MRKSILLACLLAAASAAGLHAIVVRQAPDIRWVDSTGRAQGLSAFRGQPVVLVVAPSPRSGAFRSQLRRIRSSYEKLAAQKTVFLAAFTSEPGPVPSDIPFAVAADGGRVAADYSPEGTFAVAVIGRDGNLDYLTSKVLPGQRILDVVGNSFATQERLRRP
jgi:hypothetical protein